MKITLIIAITSIILLFSISVNAQELTAKQKEYEKNKVEIFTVKERDNLQYWIQQEFAKMNLSEEKEDEYINILISFKAKIGRLVDKDKDYSKEEILQEIDKLISTQNKAVKNILSKEEYDMHLETYDKLLLSIKNRIAETEF